MSTNNCLFGYARSYDALSQEEKTEFDGYMEHQQTRWLEDNSALVDSAIQSKNFDRIYLPFRDAFTKYAFDKGLVKRDALCEANKMLNDVKPMWVALAGAVVGFVAVKLID